MKRKSLPWQKAGLPVLSKLPRPSLRIRHIIQILCLSPIFRGGLRSDMPYINFYHDYFAQGRPAYVKIDYMPYNEAIEMIKDQDGIPIVAHPGVNLRNQEAVINELLDQGALGLEAFNNYHDYGSDQLLCRHCRSAKFTAHLRQRFSREKQAFNKAGII